MYDLPEKFFGYLYESFGGLSRFHAMARTLGMPKARRKRAKWVMGPHRRRKVKGRTRCETGDCNTEPRRLAPFPSERMIKMVRANTTHPRYRPALEDVGVSGPAARCLNQIGRVLYFLKPYAMGAKWK